MSVRVITGDCRDVLRTLPDESVHCCVTSPPYFGLRDYGTATWEGGDPACDHRVWGHADDKPTPGGRGGSMPKQEVIQRHTCSKCGALRIDSQIGLEPTPDAYVAEMVAVFREVHRVLRKDGTVWLNLGSSYASGGKSASRSRPSAHVPACDSDGKEPVGFQEPDCACLGPDGEYQDGTQTRRAHTVGNVLQTPPDGPQPLPTGHGSEHQDCAGASPDASPRAVPVSRTRASFRRARASCVPSAMASADQTEMPTASPETVLSAHTSACTCDIETTSAPSAARMSGTASSDLACDCGSCGICWAYLAIPLLNIKAKDLLSIPQMVAFALQADGWYLRQDIIWAKPNPMPESVRDRCTKAHEYMFLLSKGPSYFFDSEAIAEIANKGAAGSTFNRGKTGGHQLGRSSEKERSDASTRNRRSVWTVATQPYSEAHFATFPPALIEPCIKAGCPKGGTVLDPFFGAGTTGLVADRLGRSCIGIELNAEYAAMAEKRIHTDGPLFAETASGIAYIEERLG